MSQHYVYEKKRRAVGPIARSQSTLALAVFLGVAIVVGAISGQVWWLFVLLTEACLIVLCCQLLAINLPRRIRRQIKLNSVRSDGSRSTRRSDIEKESVGRFTRDATICLGFALLPVNVFVMTYCIFLPGLNRFRENYEAVHANHLIGLMLEPAIHIIVGLILFAAFSYHVLEGIYLRLLTDLDKEVCGRAEEYAVHDLLTPRSQGR